MDGKTEEKRDMTYLWSHCYKVTKLGMSERDHSCERGGYLLRIYCAPGMALGAGDTVADYARSSSQGAYILLVR